MTTETLNTVALTLLPRLNAAVLNQLYSRAGSATAIVENRHRLADILPDASPKIAEALAALPEALGRAEQECAWAEQNAVQVISIADSRYPQRLRNCPDAPLVLYFSGTADLNMRRVVSVIGTRHCTPYGRDIIEAFMAHLKTACPEVLVVSGLAYGVDINAHREALRNSLPTVGVLAHGLDQIYPRMHSDTALKMLAQGGLLTEFPSHTVIDKRNFVQRNRIVAGMADATILVESAEKGGGLITLQMAQDYNREVFAFPGSVKSEYSRGCNAVIRRHMAHLLTSAQDFLETMGWTDDALLDNALRQGIEREMFHSFSPSERSIVEALQERDMQKNELAAQTGIAIGPLSSQLFALEMRGVVRLQAGSVYHLI